MFGRRPDATRVRDLSAVRRFMPFISPRRNESLVYFAQDVPVDAALDFCERWNHEHGRDADPARRLTLFHLILRAVAVALTERPRLNRFVAGGRLWQRDGVWLTFSAKQSLDDDGRMLTLKRRIDPSVPLEQTLDDLTGGLVRSRRGERSTADRELDWLLRMPPFAIRLVVRVLDAVDQLGLLPLSMIRSDPMFCSVFIANLGSVGLEAGYHHLWEHGNCPFFGVIGRIKTDAAGRRIATIKWTFDERIEDGLYCARSLERMRETLEHPEKL